MKKVFFIISLSHLFCLNLIAAGVTPVVPTGESSLLSGAGEGLDDVANVTSDDTIGLGETVETAVAAAGPKPPSKFDGSKDSVTEVVDDGSSRLSGNLDLVTKGIPAAGKIIKDSGAAAQSALEDALASETPPSKEQALADARLIKLQAERERKRKEFLRSEAEKAHNEEVRKNLIIAAEASKVRAYLAARRTQMMLDMAELARMAAVALKNKEDIKSVTPDAMVEATAATQQSKTGRGLASVSEQESKPESSLSDKSKEKTPTEADAEKKSLTASAKDEAKKKLAKKRRNRIKAKNGSSISTDDANEEDGDEMFGLNLTPQKGDDVRDPASAESQKEKEQNPILAAINEQFSMSGMNTESEVKKIVNEIDQYTQSETLMGILGSETLSLFERVKNAYDKCVRDSCVGELKK